MRKLITMLTLMLGVFALSATAFAHGGPGDNDGRGDHDGHKKGHKHGHKHGHFFKRTFTVTTTDGGSCGADWATDVVKRTYVVKKNRDGSYTLTRFDRGQFTTLAGVSPGACDTTGDHGHTVRAGVQGRLIGFIRGTVTGGTFDKNATCTGPECGFRDVFLKTFFGPTAQYSCDTNSSDCKFNFIYGARDQGLLFHHWQDKGTGAGTMLNEEFNGDIADA
jgi:hypothetical protein